MSLLLKTTVWLVVVLLMVTFLITILGEASGGSDGPEPSDVAGPTIQ